MGDRARGGKYNVNISAYQLPFDFTEWKKFKTKVENRISRYLPVPIIRLGYRDYFPLEIYTDPDQPVWYDNQEFMSWNRQTVTLYSPDYDNYVALEGVDFAEELGRWKLYGQEASADEDERSTYTTWRDNINYLLSSRFSKRACYMRPVNVDESMHGGVWVSLADENDCFIDLPSVVRRYYRTR